LRSSENCRITLAAQRNWFPNRRLDFGHAGFSCSRWSSTLDDEGGGTEGAGVEVDMTTTSCLLGAGSILAPGIDTQTGRKSRVPAARSATANYPRRPDRPSAVRPPTLPRDQAGSLSTPRHCRRRPPRRSPSEQVRPAWSGEAAKAERERANRREDRCKPSGRQRAVEAAPPDRGWRAVARSARVCGPGWSSDERALSQAGSGSAPLLIEGRKPPPTRMRMPRVRPPT